MGEKNPSKYMKKYGLSPDLLDNTLSPSNDSQNSEIAIKTQEEIGVVKK